ncbi:unnamed protein product [Coccothraustes coccothraustes]
MQMQHLPLASLNPPGLARTRLPSPSQCGRQKPLPSFPPVVPCCSRTAAHAAQAAPAHARSPGAQRDSRTLNRNRPASPTLPAEDPDSDAPAPETGRSFLAPQSPGAILSYRAFPAPPTPSRGPRTLPPGGPGLSPLTVSPAANAAKTSQRHRGGNDANEPRLRRALCPLGNAV